MATSNATTVTQYLRELPPDRRKVIVAVRKTVLDHLPDGYEEAMNWGMITYQVPFTLHPRTYNGQPLMYAALAAQKNYFVLHLMGVYGSKAQLQELTAAYKQAGKTMDMGKGCLRFKSLDDLPLETVGRVIAALPATDFVAICEKMRGSGRSARRKT
jgi:hypothetical protein